MIRSAFWMAGNHRRFGCIRLHNSMIFVVNGIVLPKMNFFLRNLEVLFLVPNSIVWVLS